MIYTFTELPKLQLIIYIIVATKTVINKLKVQDF